MANSQPQYFIGLLSGTSVDAVDVAICDCADGVPSLIASHNEDFPIELRQQILNLFEPGSNEIDRLGELDIKLGELFAQAVNALLDQANIDRSQIIAIGSHGQTLRHRPNCERPFTLQVGDPNTIAEKCGINVVADFRRRDMAAGGQGAPLVPAFHQAHFSSPAHERCIINIGGIANLSLLTKDGQLTGFDTGPGNGLMDFWIHHCQQTRFDRNGEWARTGRLNESLLQAWLEHPYFQKPAPKSTGKEEFSSQWLKDQLANTLAPLEDIQRTLLEFTVTTIASAVEQYSQGAEVYVCGGGAQNVFLLEQLQNKLDRPVNTTEALGLHPDWVEATAFAWLAYRRWQQLPGNSPSVTGAKGDRILGAIYLA